MLSVGQCPWQVLQHICLKYARLQNLNFSTSGQYATLFTSLHSSVLEMGVLSHLLSHCCIDGGLCVSEHSLDACPVYERHCTVRICCPRPHCAEHCPQSPVTQRGGGHRPKLQRMRTGGLLSSWHWAAGKVFKRSLLLHRTIRCLNPGPHFGVHSDQSKATHCGGQDWLLQGSFSIGRCVKQLVLSSVSSSEGPIFLIQRTVRERTPPSQVLLHSDQSPINHSGGQGSVLQALWFSGGLLSGSQ